jgi:hypothetical protein
MTNATVSDTEISLIVSQASASIPGYSRAQSLVSGKSVATLQSKRREIINAARGYEFHRSPAEWRHERH